MAGLYAHIPFCSSKCGYCRFVSSADMRPARVSRFLELLEKEAADRAARFGKGPFDTLYLGGGTPSALDEESFSRVCATLQSNFRFCDGAEFTVEANPGDMTPDKAAAFRRCGATRLSLGAQTLNAKNLAALGRKHRPEDTARAVALARGAGINNVSLDLMVCLPGQRPEDVAFDLDGLLALEPGQITVYELTIEPGTAYEKLHAQGRLALPDEETQTRIVGLVQDRLEAAGYRRYELLSYAKPGFESRHNLNYWHNGPYLGLGPGAFSYMDGCRFVLAQNVADWFSKLEAGDFEPAESERLDGARRECETLLLGLRLDTGVELSAFPALAGHLAAALPQLQAAGLVIIGGGRLRLTRKGMLLAETVFETLVP